MRNRIVRFPVVLCDLDGTLVDSHHDIGAAFQHGLRSVLGVMPPPVPSIAAHIGKPLAEMARQLGYHLAPEQLEAFLLSYRQYYAEHCAHHSRPYPGVETTLLRLTGTTFGVVTTKWQDHAEAVLEQLRLAHFFRHVQGGTPGLRLKPAPDTVLAALEALRCAPHQALMVGDTAADILAGRAAGIRTCAVTYGFGSMQELRHSQPDYWVDSFAELVEIVHAGATQS